MLKINFKYSDLENKTIIHFWCDTYKIEDLFIFEDNTFNKYVDLSKELGERIDYNTLKQDIAETVVNYMASIPYTVEQLVNDMRVSVHSSIFKIVI